MLNGHSIVSQKHKSNFQEGECDWLNLSRVYSDLVVCGQDHKLQIHSAGIVGTDSAKYMNQFSKKERRNWGKK